MRVCLLVLLVGLGGSFGPVRAGTASGGRPADAVPGDVRRGMQLYRQRCADCHSVDDNDTGPRHRGVLGRSAGTVPGFEYSPALRRSGLVWTPRTLDAWLRDPDALVPGQAMEERVSDARARRDLIAYLATLR